MTRHAGLDAIRARSAARLAARPFAPGEPTAEDDLRTPVIDALQQAEAEAEEADEVRGRFDDLHASCELWARLSRQCRAGE